MWGSSGFPTVWVRGRRWGLTSSKGDIPLRLRFVPVMVAFDVDITDGTTAFMGISVITT